MKKKRGQVTIFIIVAIMIVVMVSLFLIVRRGIIPQIGGKAEENPEIFMEACMQDSVQEVLNTLANQGGFMENDLYKRFRFSEETDYTDIPLLCYTKDYYVPCINQQPMYISQINQEVKDATTQIVDECFDSLAESLEKKNEVVDINYTGFEVEFQEGRIIFDIDSRIVLTNSGETEIQEDLEIIHLTKFYDIAKVVQEIISQEAEYCNFESVGFMLIYPKYHVKTFTTSDSILIYRVEYKETGEQFKFAVRGCIRPPGL